MTSAQQQQPAGRGSAARHVLRSAGVLAAVAFVALLAYGLTTTAPDGTIDDALSRGEAVAAPCF